MPLRANSSTETDCQNREGPDSGLEGDRLTETIGIILR